MRNNPEETARRQSFDGQAAWEWLPQQIDAAFVTLYLSDTQQIVEYVGRFKLAVSDADGRSLVFPGLITFEEDEEEKSERSDLLLEQVQAVLYGAHPTSGVALFRAKRFSPDMARLLGANLFSEPAVPFWGDHGR